MLTPEELFPLYAELALGLAGFEAQRGYQVAGASSLAISLSGGVPLFETSRRHAADPDSTSEPWSLYVSLATFIVLWSLFVGAIFSQAAFALLVAGFSVSLLHGLWMFVRLLTRPN